MRYTFVDVLESMSMELLLDRKCQNKRLVVDNSFPWLMMKVIRVKQLNDHRFDSMLRTKRKVFALVFFFSNCFVWLTHSFSCHTCRQIGQSNFFISNQCNIHSLQNSYRWLQLINGISTDLFSKQIQQTFVVFDWLSDVKETVEFIQISTKKTFYPTDSLDFILCRLTFF